MRPMHPDDARRKLREYARRRKAADERVHQLIAELANLSAASRAAGLTMSEIAQLAGVSRSTLYDSIPKPTADNTAE